MPLELTPLLDLTPLDEEESDRGYERPPRGEMLEPEIPRPQIGEGPEDIPPGMSAGIAPRPTEAEWEQARKQSRLGEEIAGTMAEGELVGRTARMFEPNLPRNLLAPTTEEAVKEGEAFRASIPPELQLPQPSFRPPLSPETRESLAAGEALSGTLADLSSADQAVILGGAALSGGIPGAAGRILHGAIPATFGVEGAKSIYEGAKTLLSEDATPEERGQAKVQMGMGATMLPGLGGLVKRPAIPPRAVEAIQKAESVGLKKSAVAAAKTIEVEAKVEPVTKGETNASKTETVEAQPKTQAEAPAVPREPARGEGGAQPEVLLTPEAAKAGVPSAELTADIARYNEIQAELKKDPEALFGPLWAENEAIKNKYGGFVPVEPPVKSTNKITLETQPERIVVQAEQDLGGGETMPGYVTIQSKGNSQSGPVEAWRAAGHEIPDTAGLLSGTYTVAELKARANEKAKTKTNPESAPTSGAPAEMVARPSKASAAEVMGQLAAVFGGSLKKRQIEAMLDNPNSKTAVKVIFQEAFPPSHWRNLAQEFGGSPEAVHTAALERGVEMLDQAKRALGIETKPTNEKAIPAATEATPAAADQTQVPARQAPVVEPGVGAVPENVSGAQPLPEPAGQIKAGEGLPKLAASQATTKSAEVSRELVPGTYAAGAKVIADKLRAQFKTETGGKAFTGPVEIINAAVEVAAKVIEYGGSAADAMAAAVKHIRMNWKGEFDEAAFRTRFDEAIKVPDTAGENVKMRKSAERATTAPEIPTPVQERIEAAPESRYTQQSMARVEDAVKTMSDADLAVMPAESNLYVASKLEQADRRFRAGDNDAGYAIFVELEKQGTSFGQNINQFKRLAATKPEFVATVIDKKLTKAGKDPLTPAQREQAIETTRRGKEADLALDKSTDAWTKKPTAENAAKAEAALDKANAEAVELQKFVAKFEPRSTSGVLKSVLQGNLLTPISEVANLFGNMSFLPFRALDRAVGTGLDIIDSAVRGKPRELSVQPLAGTAEALKGVGRGLKQIPSVLIEGTGNVIKGETRAGLHPIKAWINQFAKNPEMPTTGGKITLKDRLNLAIEGTFGVPAEAMLRGLGAGDAPFKEGARARVTAEQLKLNNVPRGNWAFAQKFPELFLDKAALDQIHKDTMAAVFQRESKTLNYLTNLAKSKGELLDFVVATVAPYKLTPWNIVSEILSYNPLIALTRGVYDAGKGNTRAAKLNAGKVVVGSMLTGAGIWLYKNGLLAPSLDERDEAQKARVLSGKVLPPNHINISGLKRATAGGDPEFKAGDETVDVFRAGGLAGAMFYMTANIGRDMERGPKATDADLWTSILRQSTLEQARFGLNQSFLSGIEGLLTAIKEGNADNFLRQWANTTASIALPNTLNTISRASRQYQPDVAKDFPARIKSKMGFAGLDDYLPLKRDFWGKPMLETPEGRDAIFYHFFDISKNKQVTSDPVELELYRLWRKTGDSAVIPSLPQRDITLGKLGYALDPKQYERYAELVGTNRRNIVDAMVINPNFHKLDDERKIGVLERAYRDGMERGKGLFYREFNGQLTPKQGRAGFTP